LEFEKCGGVRTNVDKVDFVFFNKVKVSEDEH